MFLILLILCGLTSMVAAETYTTKVGTIRTVKCLLAPTSPSLGYAVAGALLWEITLVDTPGVIYYFNPDMEAPKEIAFFKSTLAEAITAKVNGTKVYLYWAAYGGARTVYGLSLVTDDM